MAIDSIPHRLLEQAKKRPHDPAYFVRTPGDSGHWVPTNWATYAKQVRQCAKALIANGFEAGQNVCILGFNRPEWVIFDVAAMMAGGAPAGIYTTNSPEEVQYITDHAEAPFLLIENEEQWAKVDAVRGELPHLRKVVFMQGAHVADELTLGWDEFLATGDAEGLDAKLEERMEGLEADQLATLIYTSGTTGPPKGVMISHHNLTFTSAEALKLLDVDGSYSTLSYLPLSHIAEQVFTIHGPISAGYPVYFAESVEALPENLKEVQPAVFFGVPRVWEKFHSRLNDRLGQATGAKAKLVAWAMGVGRKANAERTRGREPSGLLALQYRLADRLIFSKVKPLIGLSNAKACVSGAAPIAGHILEFFTGLDVIINEVYGQSEGTGPTTFNRPGRVRFGTVGEVFPGGELRIAEDGEICYRGPNVFMGYFRNEAATAETLQDGWLHSGDLGEVDAEGFLTITGRKKDIIITAGGKNIAPKNIEATLKDIDLINEAVVIGDRRKYLTALLTLDPDAAPVFAEKHGVAVENLHDSDALRTYLSEKVEAVNARFARVEGIKDFRVLPRNLSIEDGELTPTMKVKRNVVNERYAAVIDQMYES